MTTGLIVLNERGEIVECNPAAEHILGIGREKLLSRSIAIDAWNAVRPDERPLPAAEFPGSIALRERRAVLDVEMGVRPDPRVDLYSIGVLLVRLMTGKLPDEGGLKLLGETVERLRAYARTDGQRFTRDERNAR